MSYQNPEQVPVTFSDVAAYFSEEEWKLLHEWQNEIYQTVMKEIYQALMSLGPLIATAIFSLRAKEKQHPCPVGSQDFERRYSVSPSPCNTNSNSDVSCEINQGARQHLLEHQGAGRRESKDCLRAGDTNSNSDASCEINQGEPQHLLEHQGAGRRESKDCLRAEGEAITPIAPIIKEEEYTDYMGHQDSDKRKHINNPTGFNFLNTESEARFVGHLGAEGRESGTHIISGQATITQTALYNNEDEGGIDSMDHWGEKTREGLNITTRNGRKGSREEDALQFYKTMPPNKALSAKVSVVPESDHRIQSKIQLWSEGSQYLEEEKTVHCTSSFMYPAYSGLYEGIPNIEISNKCNASESDLRSAHLGTLPQDTKLNCVLFQCTECEKSFRRSIDLIRHIRTHTGERPYRCTKCQKSFSRSSNLFRHQRTHSRARPYQCTTCEQSFKQQGHLKLHQKTHTGESEKHPNTTGLGTVYQITES